MRTLKFLAVALFATSAWAWQPTKPVTVIFPNGPGAGNEISFRIVADIVEKSTGTKFVPEYRPGADGNIAINHFVTTPADGHTIAVPACQSNWVTPEVWYPKVIKYNPMDLEPIANIARSPLAFWAHPGSRINTPEELVAAIPERRAGYEKLLHAAADLHETRRRRLTDACGDAIAAEFDRAAGPQWSARLPNTGALLCAAVADELEGNENAVDSLRAWLIDAARFPAAWIAAVEATLAQARQQAAAGTPQAGV